MIAANLQYSDGGFTGLEPLLASHHTQAICRPSQFVPILPNKVQCRRPCKFLIDELIKPDSRTSPAVTNGNNDPTSTSISASVVDRRKRKRLASEGRQQAADSAQPPEKRRNKECVDDCQAASNETATTSSFLPADLSHCVPHGNSQLLNGVRIEMDDECRALWKEFDFVRTEMIVTRAGRRFYPVVKIRLENCDPTLFYYVLLDTIPVDGCRYQYRYCKSKWKTAGKADSPPPYRLFLHPDSPFTGANHSQPTVAYTIQFDKAKLTNFQHSSEQPCHKNHAFPVPNHISDQVRIHVLALKHRHPCISSFNSSEMREFLLLHRDSYHSFEFPYTNFYAVTAYQNGLVKQLKIKHNPFAKGFRDKEDTSADVPDYRRAHRDSHNGCIPHARFYDRLHKQRPSIPNECQLGTFLHCLKTSHLVVNLLNPLLTAQREV